MTASQRILSIPELVQRRAELRGSGRLGLCHGCFDILHAGHVHHLQKASELVDILVVSLTPARFINKGDGRPVFHDRARLTVLAALRPVSLVTLNDQPTVASLIRRLRPDLYVKGADYARATDPDLAQELQALEEVGGQFVTTDNAVFDSSTRAAQQYAQWYPK
jgi:rfaE bifunctional protein nucleotidyltransferase chain/domain